MAEELRQRAEDAEPRIGQDVSEAAELAGGKLIGLRSRLKSREKIAEKIGRQLGKYRPFITTDEEAAETIMDTLRYTFRSDTENHPDSVRAMLEELRRRGYEYDEETQPENNWVRGTPYKGINVNLTKGGFTFELQFHTHESFQAVKDNHGLYEEWRKQGIPDDRKRELEAQMIERSDQVPFPPGIEHVGVLQG